MFLFLFSHLCQGRLRNPANSGCVSLSKVRDVKDHFFIVVVILLQLPRFKFVCVHRPITRRNGNGERSLAACVLLAGLDLADFLFRFWFLLKSDAYRSNNLGCNRRGLVLSKRSSCESKD